MSIATVAKGKGIFLDSTSKSDQYGPVNIWAKFQAFIIILTFFAPSARTILLVVN